MKKTNSISFDEARKIAKKYIELVDCTFIKNELVNELVIVDSSTLTEDFGWVFFYTSKKFLETSEIKYAIGGNAPIIVDKSSGKVTVTGTAYDIEDYIEEYRKKIIFT